MRIHRTTPTRSFSTFTNALLRDRSISWCAAGVLLYLLSLPPNARASVRSLAEQRKEGRARIADALRDLERSGYLRRVLVKNPESGELSTVYEVFDRPYADRVTEESAAGVPEMARTWPPVVAPPGTRARSLREQRRGNKNLPPRIGCR